MSDKPEGLIRSILDSYKKDDITVRIDKGNYVNKEVLIQVVGELRKILFPGYFDSNCVKGDYIEYIVGERIEYIQYHLKKQIARVLGSAEICEECPKSMADAKAEKDRNGISCKDSEDKGISADRCAGGLRWRSGSI